MHGPNVAPVATVDGYTRDQVEANARLIAAAPELLETLRELIEAVWDGRLESEGAEAFTDPARAAIAKVEGK